MCLCSYILHVFQGLKRIVGKRGAVDEGVASAGRGPVEEVGKGVQPLERRPSYGLRYRQGDLFHQQEFWNSVEYFPPP